MVQVGIIDISVIHCEIILDVLILKFSVSPLPRPPSTFSLSSYNFVIFLQKGQFDIMVLAHFKIILLHFDMTVFCIDWKIFWLPKIIFLWNIFLRLNNACGLIHIREQNIWYRLVDIFFFKTERQVLGPHVHGKADALTCLI